MASSGQHASPKTAKFPGYAKIVSVLLVAEFVGTFESAMIFIALPSMMHEFNVDAAAIGWAATAFLLVAAASAAVCGRLGDMYGRKKLLAIVLAISVVGSIISFTFGSLEGVILGRALQGVAGATLPLCLGLARQELPKERVPNVIALIAGSSFLAGAGGNLIAGVLLQLGNWKALFIVSGAMGLIAALMVITLLKTSPVARGEARGIDYVGGLLFAPAVALVLYGLTNASAWGVFSGRTLGFVLGGLAVAALWVAWELRVSNPMINLRLLKTNKMALTQLCTAVLGIGPLVAVGILTPLILLAPATDPAGLGVSPAVGGLIIFSAATLSFVGSPFSGKVAAAVGARRALLIGIVISFVGYSMMFWADNNLLTFVINTYVIAIGVMFTYTAFPNLVAESVPLENTSEGMGINTVTRTIFMAVGTTVLTVALASSTVEGTMVSTESAFNTAYIIISVSCVIGFLLALRIKDTPRTDAADPQDSTLSVQGH
ncbi:MFS transporter [Glutamicibacter protophormiae]|uniref:MFS family permease n=1 Tax=Glutamicibacter protophormiae TaxID=37930 RepID=A0ABS4XMS3_GLUPR|nr:MFS transporter [Glutamicibacter protophormiae]MBP2397816.1 MFS family permease [Glutamicibacter protophormiae]GGL86354.1 MFS transporter [Glutamicibacter protophormiae]